MNGCMTSCTHPTNPQGLGVVGMVGTELCYFFATRTFLWFIQTTVSQSIIYLLSGLNFLRKFCHHLLLCLIGRLPSAISLKITIHTQPIALMANQILIHLIFVS